MKKRIYRHYLIYNLLLALFICIGMQELKSTAALSRLSEHTVHSEGFRMQPVSEAMLKEVEDFDEPGEVLALYWLETDFEEETKTFWTAEQLLKEKEKWQRRPQWEIYAAACQAVWDDLVYFPIPEDTGNQDMTVTFENSWMFSRDYKGERGHEGTDIMPSVDERGLYPVVSMTDGVVTQKGWLELGGWRLGIETEKGAYFYYAHLDSYADVEVGDTVKAGDLLGYMGDTGYSKEEGTTGNFPVHLHVGIYLYLDGEEISVNPYPALKFLEESKISCVYEHRPSML